MTCYLYDMLLHNRKYILKVLLTLVERDYFPYEKIDLHCNIRHSVHFHTYYISC